MDDKKRRDDKEKEVEQAEKEVSQGVILGSEERATPESAEEKDSGQARMTNENEENVLLQKIKELEEQSKRFLADYQNLQRRTQEEKREWARLANKDLVLKILPVLDTLMLAEKHTQDKSFALSVQQFLQVLQDEGVTKIKTVGEEFNPTTMEAVSTTEGKSGKVMEELRSGYTFYDTILRPAQVTVGQ